MATGTICFLSDTTFGFIREDETRSRFFLHRDSMARGREEWGRLNEGDRVAFEVMAATDGRPNPRAVGVRVTQRRLPEGVVTPRRPSLRHAEAWQRSLLAVSQEAQSA